MENEHRIPKRSEVPVEDTWAIEDLYPTDDAWEEDLLRLQAAQSALTVKCCLLICSTASRPTSLRSVLQHMQCVSLTWIPVMPIIRRWWED